MKSLSLTPNSVTYGCLLDACVKNSDTKRANEVFECMLRDKIPMNTILYTTMIKAYSKEWQLDKAYSLYEKMLDQMKDNPSVAPNTVTYNSLIDICVRCFDIPRAQKLFD